MSSRIRDASASEVATAHSSTDAETTTTPSIDAVADRTRIHDVGPSDRDQAGRPRWSR